MEVQVNLQVPSTSSTGDLLKTSTKQTSSSSNLNTMTLYYTVFPGNGPQVIRDALERRCNGRVTWKEVNRDAVMFHSDQPINFIWKPTNFNYKMYSLIDKANAESLTPLIPGKQLVVNHLENIRGICTKTGLVRTLKQFYKTNSDAIECGYSVFDTTPTSFVVTSQLDTYEFHQFVSRYMDLQKNEGYSFKERTPQKHCGENYWLVKPANMNQGRGIEIFNSLQEIQKFLSSRQLYSYWVVQKYIEKPLLFKGRKFDIRMWAFGSHKQEFYYYKKGYLRTSSDAYSLDNENNYVHLTNNCLQKNGDNYGKHEDGNTVGFEAFQEYLDQVFPQYKLNVEEHFIKRIQDLMLDVYQSARKTLNPHKRRNCFEFFGFDFLIDEDFRVWLIEVNTNPYLGVPNDYIKTLLPKMMDDLFRIVLDPVFCPDLAQASKSDNGFELLYSHNLGVNKRGAIDEGLYPVPELAQPRRKVIKPKFVTVKRPDQLKRQRDAEQSPVDESLVASMNSTLSSKKQLKTLLVHTPYGSTLSSQPSSQSRLGKHNLSQSSPQQNRSFQTHKGLKSQSEFYSAQNTSDLDDSYQLSSLQVRDVYRGSHLRTQQSIPEVQDEDCTNTRSMFTQKRTTITDQVQQLQRSDKTFKKDVATIIQRIVSTFLNWELFSDKEIKDSTLAFEHLATSFHYSCFADDTIVSQIFKIISSKKTPLKIKCSTIQAFIVIVKNINFKKYFLQSSPMQQIQPAISFALESCNPADNESSEENDEIQMISSKLLLALLCLPQAFLVGGPRKFYIPGETTDLEKMRQKAIEYGILSIVVFIDSKCQNDKIKTLFQKDLWGVLDDNDYQQQLTKPRGPNPFLDETQMDEVDAIVRERHQTYTQQKSIQQKEDAAKRQILMAENQKRKEMLDREQEDKKKKAEEIFSKRMEERRKVQLENMRKEMQEREELLKEDETRKKMALDCIRKKEEMRKQVQVESYKKRLEEENKKAEESEKKRLERAEERKRALEEWHKNKTKNRDSTSRDGAKKHKRISKVDPADFKTSIILSITESFLGRPLKGEVYQTIDSYCSPTGELERNHKDASHLSLTVAVRSPRNRAKYNISNSLATNGKGDKIEESILEDILQNHELQVEDQKARMKPSRSLRALKGHSKRRQLSKDIKPSQEMIYYQHHAPSQASINMGDLRLFSIYGVPPSNNPIFMRRQAKAQKQKKRKDPSLILQEQLPITLTDTPNSFPLNSPHD